MKIDAEIAALPVGHLQLKGKARRATSGFKTIGDVMSVLAGRQQAPSWTSHTAVHIDRVVRVLVSATGEKGMKAWDVFRKSRPLLADPHAIFFASPTFTRLSKEVRKGSAAKLHLNRRAITALHKLGVQTIEGLIDLARAGIDKFPLAGNLTTVEITEALDALANSIEPNGDVNWLTYAQHRRFAILPSNLQQHYSSREFVRSFPKACEFAVNSKFGSAAVFVLRKRILRHPDICLPLSEIGRYLGQTAERVRQHERNILKLLACAIWNEEYRGCRFRFSSQFLDPLRRLDSALRRFRNLPLPITGWHGVLRDCWALTPEDLGEQEALLLQLLGFEPFVSSHVSMILSTPKDKRAVRSAGIEANRLLMRRFTEWISTQEVWECLRKKLHSATPEPDEVRTLLCSMPNVEQHGDAHRIKLEKLRFSVDRYERILRERGTPMHYREIIFEVERRSQLLRRTPSRAVASAMANCPRFVPIGRTGLWSLREWKHIETGTVADVAAELLSASERPLNEKELFAMISPRRTLRLQSIATLLREDSRFQRVAPTKWALKETKSSAEIRRRLRRERLRVASRQAM